MAGHLPVRRGQSLQGHAPPGSPGSAIVAPYLSIEKRDEKRAKILTGNEKISRNFWAARACEIRSRWQMRVTRCSLPQRPSRNSEGIAPVA